MKNQIVSLLTAYDEKQSSKKSYNRYALGIYLNQLDNVILDIELGADPRAAIVAGFNGRLLDFILRGLGMAVSSKEEQMGSGIYAPVSANHPEA
jgi:hypothetical protein